MSEIDVEKLYELAGDEVEKLAAELSDFNYFLNEQYEIKNFLTDYSTERSVRQGILDQLSQNASPLLKELLLILGKELLHEFSSITEELIALVEEKRKTKFVRIKSAFPLSQAEIEEITETCGARVKYEVVVEPELLGGFVIKYADGRVFDGSVRGQLEKLKMELVQ